MRILGVLLTLFLASAGWLYYKAFVHDEPLSITASTIEQLQFLRKQAKFADLPGEDTKAERDRNESNLNELLDRIIAGLSAHPPWTRCTSKTQRHANDSLTTLCKSTMLLASQAPMAPSPSSSSSFSPMCVASHMKCSANKQIPVAQIDTSIATPTNEQY